jgi:hypothetical protein
VSEPLKLADVAFLFGIGTRTALIGARVANERDWRSGVSTESPSIARCAARDLTLLIGGGLPAFDEEGEVNDGGDGRPSVGVGVVLSAPRAETLEDA